MLRKMLLWLTHRLEEHREIDLNNLEYFMNKEMDWFMTRQCLDHAHTMYIVGGSHVATSCPLARHRRLRECTKMVYLKEGGF